MVNNKPLETYKGIEKSDIEKYPILTRDNVRLLLTRFKGGDNGPVLLSHGLGVSSEIFTTSAIHTNLATYLYSKDYDVWLLDFRASVLLPSSKMQFTGDDVALKDYPAAINTVRKITVSEDIQVVAHCYGSTTLIMSMLAGLQGVRSAVCSQVATHMTTPLMTRVKVSLYFARLLWFLGVNSLDAAPKEPRNSRERLFDFLLKLYPVKKGEKCSNNVCRRIAFMYARLYKHSLLSETIHKEMKSLFGVANMNAFMHLAAMTRAGFVLNKKNTDSYLPWIKRLNIPITFIHGSENVCFNPESTEITYNLLRNYNEKELYKRYLIPGYSHIDCIFGKDASKDVFPYILEHLESSQKKAKRQESTDIRINFSPGLGFHEKMFGNFIVEREAETGSVSGKLSMTSTINIYDLASFFLDPEHRCYLSSKIMHPFFNTSVYSKEGVLKLFSPSEDPEMRLMVYEVSFNYEGTEYFLAGKKHVKNDYYLDFWKDTTTLFTTLYKGKDKSGTAIGKGTLRVSVIELTKLLFSFHAINVETCSGRTKTLFRFFWFFLSNIFEVYFSFLKRNKRD